MSTLARIPVVRVAALALVLATSLAVVGAPEHRSPVVVAGPERCC